jgi:hypothetical protein
MTKYIFFAGGMEEGNRDMKIRSTAVMSTSALTWRSSCPGVGGSLQAGGPGRVK